MEILKEHNIATYHKLEEMIMYNQKVALVQATGTGKSFIAMQLMHDYFEHKSKLVLAPQSAILDNFAAYKENNFSNIDYLTYQALLSKSDDELIDMARDYGLIVMDELHRTGASEWNKQIQVIMNNLGVFTKVLGLTATPIRYLDDSRDMTEELFEGHAVNGIGLAEAIARGILPSVEYVAALHHVEDRAKEYISNLNDTSVDLSDVKAKFELTLENIEAISDIVKKHTKRRSKNQKWIVFCESLSQIQEIDEDLRLWLGDQIDIFEVSSNNTKRQNAEQQAIFSAKMSGINAAKTVDMFNEGVHIDGVTGIFMLRKTTSPNIWYQQLGRALAAAAGNSSIIVFDFVDNHNSLKAVHKTGSLLGELQREIREYSDKPDLLIVKDYSIPVMELFEKIDKELGLKKCRWTEEEDNILRKYYHTEGKEVSSRLPGRSIVGCCNRAFMLGLSETGFRLSEFTEDETRIVLENMYKLSLDELTNIINKSRNSVKRLRASLGYDYKAKVEAVQYKEEILTGVPAVGVAKVAENLGISESMVRYWYVKFNGKATNRVNYWKPVEDKILEEYWEEGRKILDRLPGRSWFSCRNRAFKLGICASQEYTVPVEASKFIIENMDKMQNIEMAKTLKVSLGTLAKWRKIMGVQKNKVEYSEDVKEYIKNNYGKISVAQLAKDVNMPYMSCYNYILKLKREGCLQEDKNVDSRVAYMTSDQIKAYPEDCKTLSEENTQAKQNETNLF